MRPKIVVLDGYTLAPAPGAALSPAHEPAIDWAPLQTLGNLTVYDRTDPDQVVERVGDAPVILTNKTLLTAQALASLPGLRYIGVLATGVNVVDLPAARRQGITVTNAPGYSTDSVAQHVFALLLELTNHTAAHHDAVRRGQWTRCPDFSFTVAPITELAGLTFGVVGVGSIGRRVAGIASALGMNVAAAHQSSMGRVDIPGVTIRWLPLDELVTQADVLSLHCPLNDQTRHLVNAQRLARMKPTAILINTGRGLLVDDAALARALHEGRLAGAGLDVLSEEPPPADNPLLHAPRCVITPHMAWASTAVKRRLMDLIAKNIRAFLDGRPVNVVT